MPDLVCAYAQLIFNNWKNGNLQAWSWSHTSRRFHRHFSNFPTFCLSLLLIFGGEIWVIFELTLVLVLLLSWRQQFQQLKHICLQFNFWEFSDKRWFITFIYIFFTWLHCFLQIQALNINWLWDSAGLQLPFINVYWTFCISLIILFVPTPTKRWDFRLGELYHLTYLFCSVQCSAECLPIRMSKTFLPLLDTHVYMWLAGWLKPLWTS